MIESILFCEFDNKQGPKISFQFPENKILTSKFSKIAKYIVTKPEYSGNVITISVDQFRVMGCSTVVQSGKYERNMYIFNICFVFSREINYEKIIPYEKVIEKLSRIMKLNEEQNQALSNIKKRDEIQQILIEIYQELNQKKEFQFDGIFSNRKKPTDTTPTNPLQNEMSLKNKRVNDLHENLPLGIYLKTIPKFGKYRYQIRDDHVPIFIQQIESYPIGEWDLAVQKVLSKIDGKKYIKLIAYETEIELEIVKICISRLLYLDIIRLVNVFQYANTYISTPNIFQLLHNKELQKKCLKTVLLHPISEISSYFSNKIDENQNLLQIYFQQKYSHQHKEQIKNIESIQQNLEAQRNKELTNDSSIIPDESANKIEKGRTDEGEMGKTDKNEPKNTSDPNLNEEKEKEMKEENFQMIIENSPFDQQDQIFENTKENEIKMKLIKKRIKYQFLHKIFTLYCRLSLKSNYANFCRQYSPHKFGIDEVSLITFGELNYLISKVQSFPILEIHKQPLLQFKNQLEQLKFIHEFQKFRQNQNNEQTQNQEIHLQKGQKWLQDVHHEQKHHAFLLSLILKTFDGKHSFDQICCDFGIDITKLLQMIKISGRKIYIIKCPEELK
ncbi:nitrogen permease regulator 2/tumor suppressor candidate 4 [Anaeramoeba ignava]|uniref:Nitrogen permease regulator 2/tumor suppressor candidate 4 n=1 Tax=Anaeramoeba ignava TaxID=1746090 RepID=A0A9Q0R9L2_ANAIG|nr:nitrogen permease regulator 2/tumor suppressor candidate 4 [Anaeramoeba ignava]